MNYFEGSWAPVSIIFVKINFALEFGGTDMTIAGNSHHLKDIIIEWDRQCCHCFVFMQFHNILCSVAFEGSGQNSWQPVYLDVKQWGPSRYFLNRGNLIENINWMQWFCCGRWGFVQHNEPTLSQVVSITTDGQTNADVAFLTGCFAVDWPGMKLLSRP